MGILSGFAGPAGSSGRSGTRLAVDSELQAEMGKRFPESEAKMGRRMDKVDADIDGLRRKFHTGATWIIDMA